VEEWLINRAMDVLTITVPLLFVFGRKEKLYSFSGLFALLITLKRAPLFTVEAVSLLTHVIRSGKIRPFLVVATLGVIVYASSQLLFLGLLNRDVEPSDAYAAMASGFPEVRDFGLILGLNEGRLHWGSTLVQPFLPIPSFVSPWVQNHSLRRVTTNLIGLDPEETGGLRITLAGEGYLNFGICGAIIVSGLWGWAMRKVSNSIAAARRSQDGAAAFVVALILCWLAFWIYLAGSSSSGFLKSGLVITLMLFLLCRKGGQEISVN
jgi:hypothetical protein